MHCTLPLSAAPAGCAAYLSGPAEDLPPNGLFNVGLGNQADVSTSCDFRVDGEFGCTSCKRLTGCPALQRTLRGTHTGEGSWSLLSLFGQAKAAAFGGQSSSISLLVIVGGPLPPQARTR